MVALSDRITSYVFLTVRLLPRLLFTNRILRCICWGFHIDINLGIDQVAPISKGA